jgi:hypothetical protein
MHAGQCSDVAGEVAASLAHAAVAFKNKRKLRERYWRKAVQVLPICKPFTGVTM